MRVSLPPTSVPVYLASLSPRMLELTGEIADGWLGTSFVPEGASAYFTHLDAGLARQAAAGLTWTSARAPRSTWSTRPTWLRTVASRKKELAFSLGGMGSGTSNFYNDAYSRQGWADVAAQVRARWQAGDRDGAAGLVTDEMVLATTLIGTEDMVRARLRTWRDAGVDTVRLYPAGDTLAARLDNLGRGINLVRSLRPAGSLLSRTGQAAPVARPAAISRVSAGSSLTCRYMLNPVMLSSRLTMGWQPVMISSRPCLAWIVMGPGQHGQAGAVGKAERGQIRHQGLRRAVQGIADGLPQVVRAADVKLALEPQQGPLVMVFGDDRGRGSSPVPSLGRHLVAGLMATHAEGQIACRRSSPPGCDPRTHGGTNEKYHIPLGSGRLGSRALARRMPVTDLIGVRAGASAQDLGGHVGHPPARVARLLAQQVERGRRRQPVGAHQVTDRALDDHAVVQGVLQLLGHGAAVGRGQRGGQDLRDQAAVAAQRLDVRIVPLGGLVAVDVQRAERDYR